MERFQLKPTIFFGSDALAALEGLAGRRVMVITDSFLAQSGLLERVRARLRDCTVEVFDQVVPDPPLELVAQGARALAEFRPQAVVAFGGGSPMDCAKAMLEFGKKRDIGIFVTLAKPVGMWEGKFDMLCDKDDWKYLQELEKSYDVFTHMTPSYGMDMGCIAVKRMFSITQYGDVQPCPYMHTSLGNVFEEPLADIIKRGLSIKYFKGDNHTCWLALEPNFIKNHVSRAYGKQLPIPCTEYFDKEDFQ